MLADEPMSRHTSFKIGGRADMFVSVRTEEEISALISLAKETGTPYMIMGNGSNMLVGDGGIRGLVMQIGKDLSEIKTDGVYIEAQAGALLSRIASEAAKAVPPSFVGEPSRFRNRRAACPRVSPALPLEPTPSVRPMVAASAI